METRYRHFSGAHCESTVVAGLINHYGGRMTEPFVFGAGSGLSFFHAPFLKLLGLPLTSFRAPAGSVMKKSLGRLGVPHKIRRFSDPDEGMAALDRELEKGNPVACQTGLHWLPYMPPAFRLHLNMHNIVVTGTEGSDYLVSDPAMLDEIMRCPEQALKKARFSKGEMAPKGKMLTIEKWPERPQLGHAASAGIRGVCSAMLQPVFPIVGVKGMRYLARRVERWLGTLGVVETRRNLGQLVVMLEEIGTGGGGFRYQFAAFLQESAAILKMGRLEKLSARMTGVGDKWRAFALQSTRYCKERLADGEGLASMAALMRECADEEESIFRELKRITPKIPVGEAA